MQEAEQQALHEFAVEEFKKHWPVFTLSLSAICLAFGLMIYGAFKALFG